MTTPATPEACREALEHWQKRVDAYDAALAEIRRLSDECAARYGELAKAAEEKGEEWPAIPDPTPEYWAASEAWADAQKALPDPTLARQNAALLAAHAEALARERWIPVSERLPENGEKVLFVAEEKRLYGFRMDSAWYRLTGRTYYAPSVSHWRPLPAPPAPASAEGGAK